MIPFRKIFRILAFLSIIAGWKLELNGLHAGDAFITSGITLLFFLFLAGAIHIPRNSRGTPYEAGNKSDKVRFISGSSL
jgi:hypothetical protein